MNRNILTIAILLLISTISIKAQDLKKYDKGSYIKGKDSISYRILFPENFNPEKKYPILFFLHGKGETGNDNEKQLTNGGSLFLKDSFRKQFPSIVVFPQCADNSYWANVDIVESDGKRTFNFQKGGKPTKDMRALVGMVENFMEKPFVDRNQVYVGGLSMGGMGTFEILRRKPKLFAAAFAICGGDNVANVQKYKDVPLWIFHGEKDDVVPVNYSVIVSNQLKVLGKEGKLTLYPNAGHNSWDSAFAEPKLLPWLFSNTKERR